MKIRVKAKSNASRRTKNRVKEHGPVFELEKVKFNTWERLLRSDDGWFGWLPFNEIETTNCQKD
tara:strand:- start:318 stop:509 length:192 start_codon:yes stop_codon:yes gene_type:complete